MQLSTSRFNNKNLIHLPDVKLGITLKPPWFPLGYTLESNWPALAPNEEMFRLRGGDAEARSVYEKAYMERLDTLGIAKVQAFFADLLQGRAQGLILLCYEDLRDSQKWCHRRMFARWYEAQTGYRVEEIEEPLPQSQRKKQSQIELPF